MWRPRRVAQSARSGAPEWSRAVWAASTSRENAALRSQRCPNLPTCPRGSGVHCCAVTSCWPRGAAGRREGQPSAAAAPAASAAPWRTPDRCPRRGLRMAPRRASGGPRARRGVCRRAPTPQAAARGPARRPPPTSRRRRCRARAFPGRPTQLQRRRPEEAAPRASRARAPRPAALSARPSSTRRCRRGERRTRAREPRPPSAPPPSK
mmetsp:Transcript_30598/g.101806  ORF Transcript_30598/g.101806 Transcript_30598/m.101806 type:complete len:208 (+) Transcript_30598:44-667(+)